MKTNEHFFKSSQFVFSLKIHQCVEWIGAISKRWAKKDQKNPFENYWGFETDYVPVWSWYVKINKNKQKKEEICWIFFVISKINELVSFVNVGKCRA